MHPFKNSAEKKELATLRNYIGVTTGSFDITGEDETIEYVRGDEIASDNAIEKFKQAMEKAPEAVQQEKVEVVLDEPVANKSEKVEAPVKSAVEKNLG